MKAMAESRRSDRHVGLSEGADDDDNNSFTGERQGGREVGRERGGRWIGRKDYHQTRK